jgi:peptidoglycan/xylan/chitin deacetylase (PgdA/CDA1 family)
LDILKKYGVKASFFMVAENAERYQDLLDRVRAEGHTIGNHTYHHARGCKTDCATYISDIAHANEILDTPLFRPPHGRMTGEQKRAVLDAGYKIYLWDVLTHDYNKHYSVEKMLRIVQRYVRRGSIIVFHDSLKSKDRMLQVLPRVIEWLQEEGWTLKPL